MLALQDAAAVFRSKRLILLYYIRQQKELWEPYDTFEAWWEANSAEWSEFRDKPADFRTVDVHTRVGGVMVWLHTAKHCAAQGGRSIFNVQALLLIFNGYRRWDLVLSGFICC